MSALVCAATSAMRLPSGASPRCASTARSILSSRAVKSGAAGVFWAAALGYQVEDNSALSNRLLAAGELPRAAVAEHNGTRIFRGFAAIRHPDDPYDKETGIGRGRRILFQDVPEPKSAKNRFHLDVHAGPDAREATVARLDSLGLAA